MSLGLCNICNLLAFLDVTLNNYLLSDSGTGTLLESHLAVVSSAVAEMPTRTKSCSACGLDDTCSLALPL